MSTNTLLKSALIAIATGLPAQVAAQALTSDDYLTAAWMTTRFYGAQRSGEGPNWILDGTNFPTSFTQDKLSSGANISGGWFDCGDHVMFSQPQSWAAYVLAVGYSTFTTGWHDLYTGDYTDYKASGDYTRAGGTPNGLPDLLEELRYEADFWVKAAPSATVFVNQKGDGTADHARWVTAGKMSTLAVGQGGEPRAIVASQADAYSPGMVAAMLAVMARVEPEQERRTAYLTAAQNAYAFAKTKTGIFSSAGGFYQGSWWDGRWADGPFLAALELWRTTGTESYKTEAVNYYATNILFNQGGYTRFAYANAVPLSVMMAEKYLDLVSGTQNLTADGMLNNIYRSQMTNGIFTKETGGGGSFSVRTPSGGAFLHALYSVFNNTTAHDATIYKQIDYLLGVNSSKKSYVTGFDFNGAISPPAPHHRGYYGNENPNLNESATRAPAKNKYMGGMIAGDFNSGTHNTDVATWNINEVCVDLNAPMVGALGYILSKRLPAGTIPVKPGQLSPARLQMEVQNGLLVLQASENGTLRVVDAEGRLLHSADIAKNTSHQWKASNSGRLLLQFRDQQGRSATRSIMVQ